MKEDFERIKKWFERHEQKISTLSLLAGFIVDNLTLKRIDLLFENLVLFGYILISGVGIIVLNLYEEGKVKGKIFDRLRIALPYVIQFAFGGLFSGFIVFYSRGSAFLSSWPFLLLLAAILIGGELYKNYYLRLTFQVGVFFLGLFSFLIFYLPIIVGRINAWVFLLSGIVSLIILAAFLYFLSLLVSDKVKKSKPALTKVVIFAFVLINVFYFSNILPPLPLSLKDGGAYHQVLKEGSSYTAVAEKEDWRKYFRVYDRIYVVPGENVYAYSAVFSPTDLNTKIVHNWQYFDPALQRWASVNKIPFSIFGGRDGGYRGYTWKSNVPEGKWRVSVETGRGQVVGRVKFRVINIPATEKREHKTVDLQ